MNPTVSKFIFYFIILIYFPVSIFAQTSTKIAGVVKDKTTNEALIGVNVQIEGTLLGAATDSDGWYVILNVPPGIHHLQFTYLGYKSVTVQNVETKIDRTTTINVNMETAAIEFGETVTVTADRPLVEADKTSSSVHFESREVANLPVENLRNLLELTPGVSKNPDGTMSIRGGGAYEINYTVNGIRSMTTNSGVPAYGTGSKSENSWKYDINPLAISQMEVITGGFNAEYGNAQSGVVNVVMKEGESKFFGGLTFEYRSPGQYHYGDYLYSKNQFEWQKWGNFDTWLHQPQFRDTIGGVLSVDTAEALRNYNLWVKNHTPSDDNILGVYDYRKKAYSRYLFSLGGPLGKREQNITFFLSGELLFKPTRLPTREKVQKKQNYSLVLAYKPNPTHNFKITGLYQKFYSGMGSGSDDIRWAGLWGTYGAKRKYTLIYDSPRDETVFASSVNYKLIFSPRSYLETILTYQNEILYAYQTPTPAWDKDVQLHPDPYTRQLENRGPWNEKYREYYTWSSLYNQASLTQFYEGRISFSSQFTKTNLFKAGLETSFMDQNYNASSSLCVSAFIWRTGFATNYKAKTWSVAGFVQDKLEFAGMVANLGVRFDAYNFGVDVPVDKYNVFYPALGSPNVGIPKWEPSQTFSSFSPRLGISFPIGATTAFRIQYGHFRSMPTINQALDNQTYNGWGSYGNPNLKPKLSINYEVGIQKSLWGTHQFDIVTYYNDLKDQISLVYIKSSTGSQSKSDDLKGTYISYDNSGYGNSRGIEISLMNRGILNWRYRFAYTLSQTNYGNYGVYLDRPDLTQDLAQKYTYAAADYLSPEDRTHRFNASITYVISEARGIKLLGIHPLENSSLSLIIDIKSGLAYFWSPEYQYSYRIESNRRYPMESQTDLRFDKTIPYKLLKLKVGLRVYNLFNNKHFTPITDPEELDRWVLRSATLADADLNPDRDVRLYNYFQVWRNIPRQIFFTLGVLF